MLTLQNSRTPAAPNRKARRANRRKTKNNARQTTPLREVTAAQQRLLIKAVEHQKAGRLEEAGQCYRQILRTDPACAQALIGLGLLYILAEKPDEAYEYLKQAVALEPENPACWRGFSHCLKDMGQGPAAVIAATRAVALVPDDIGSLVELGSIHILNGEGEEARETLDKAVELDPDCRDAHYYRGVQQSALGDMASARSSYQRVLEIDPAFASAYMHLADLVDDEDGLESMASDIKRVIESGVEERRSLATLHFAVAKVRRRQKQYDEAFSHFATSNQTLHEVYKVNRDSIRVTVDEIIEGFQPGVFETLREAGTDTELPVFIVGMPRSGSTLVEQIVASHRDVAGAGEFLKLPEIASLLNKDLGGSARYPQRVGNFAPEKLWPAGEEYLSALQHERPAGALRITDKFLNNFFNVGLIAVLFPKATIIHCRRDPMDTCLSCYFQNFNKVNQQLAYTNDLEDLGIFYRQYERVMAHWRDVLPGRMFEVDYEEIVADQEGMSRKLIDHIGLLWDDACLAFHKSDKSAITASISQVRKPIYNSSVAAWRNYEKHLTPLKCALGIDDRE